MAASHEAMMAVLAGKPKNMNAWVMTVDPDNDALHSIEKRSVKTSQTQAWFGKQGTKRRSTKGRVSTMPNGFVKYDWVTGREVVAYQPK